MQASEGAGGVERRIACLGIAWAALVTALSGVFPVGNADTFGHLAQGRQIAQLGHVPAYDTFSFWQSAPVPWRNYEWASDLLGYCAFVAGGATALIAIKCALLACTVVLACALAWRLGGARAAALCAVLVIVAVPAMRFRFTERPHVIALPLAALYAHGVLSLLGASHDDTRGRQRVRALLAGSFALHVAWVNLHGSHLLGVMLTLVALAYAPAERRSRLGAALGLQALASCISPYGPAIVVDALRHTFDSAYRAALAEWQPWLPGDPLWLLAVPAGFVLALLIAARELSRRGSAERALLATSFLLALATLRSLRFTDAFLMSAAPLIAAGAAFALARVNARNLAIAGACAAALASGGAAFAAPRLPPYVGAGVGTSTALLPAASGDWLRRNARAPRVLAAIEDSWYLLFAAPQAGVLIDGRVPFYGVEHLARVEAMFADPRALSAALDRYAIDCVLVRHTFAAQRGLLARMRVRPGWVLASIEDRYALFVRETLALRAGARLHPLDLGPDYDLEWLLTADAARERAIRGELAALPDHENRRGYVAWVRAMLDLRPLLRAGRANGLRPPASPDERATLARSEAWLARAARGAGEVSVVHAYHALVAAALCDLDGAERALDRARAEGESRETLLGAQEIALRRGRRDEVAAFLARARSHPEAGRDAWLDALQRALDDPPRCP